MVSGDTNQGKNKYESMSMFKKYTPFLQKAIEKLEKKKKNNSDSSDLQMKLNVFSKYLQIIQDDQNVPEILAKRMESTLEDMRRRSMKADEKTKSGNKNQEDSADCVGSPLTSAAAVNTNGTELNGDSSELKQESDNEINNISAQSSLEHLESALNEMESENTSESVKEATKSAKTSSENCREQQIDHNDCNDTSSSSSRSNNDTSDTSSFNPIIKNCESISKLTSEVITECNKFESTEQLAAEVMEIGSPSKDECFAVSSPRETNSYKSSLASPANVDYTSDNENLSRVMNNNCGSPCSSNNDQPGVIDTYSCPDCPNFKDATLYDLKQHLYIHAGYQPCECSKCMCTSFEGPGKNICIRNLKIESEVRNIINTLRKRKNESSSDESDKRLKLEDGSHSNNHPNVRTIELSDKRGIKALQELVSRCGDKKDKDHFIRPSSHHSSELDDDEEEVIDTNDTSSKILKSSLNQTNDYHRETYGNMTMSDVSFEDSQHSDSSLPIAVHNIKVEPDIVMETGVNEVLNPVNGDNYFMMSMMDASRPKMPNSMNDRFVSREYCPYECSFCGNGYRTLSNYRQHTYRHFKGYFVYRCSYCNRGFMRMDHLKAHMQSWHPYQEIKYEKIDPPDDPVILVNVPKPRNSNAPGATRLASVTEMFKCAFCDHVCIPNDMAPHFMRHHPTEVPQMKILKDQNLLEKIPEPPVTREKRVAKKSTAARHIPPVSSSPQISVSRPVTVEPARKNIALKSTAKRAYNFPSPSTSSMNSVINEFLSGIAKPCVSDNDLKIWNRSRSIYVPVKDLRKMINFNCTVRLHDIINNFL